MPEGDWPGGKLGRTGGKLGRTGGIASLILAAGALAGCATTAHATSTPIKLASAFVIQGGGTHIDDAYVVIQNSGPADNLLTAISSAGGTVTLRGPGRSGSAVRQVSELSIPGHSIVRLDLAGTHLVISNPGRMTEGTDITLTLVFAHAGKVRVFAQVTNPQNGNSSYFGS
jgi:copper(I)-binding protein